MANIGGQPSGPPDISKFRAQTPDLETPLTSFETIDRSQLRQQNDSNIISVTLPGDHVADGQLKPGDSVVYVPLFDVGELEELSLSWETQGETKFLATDVVHLGD